MGIEISLILLLQYWENSQFVSTPKIISHFVCTNNILSDCMLKVVELNAYICNSIGMFVTFAMLKCTYSGCQKRLVKVLKR